MEIFHFSEQPYTEGWDADVDSLRVYMPNKHCDPEIVHTLVNQRLDEWILCDKLGLNILINEHHASATSLSPSTTITAAMLAKVTKNARILNLGIPIGNRPDPIRVAEEIAYIDCVTGGRYDIGFVKGAPYEILPSNANPVGMMERFWEAHDLILKALTSHDGPFNWEGEYFHYRQVNIWPRPFQQPRPNVWIPAGSISSAEEVGRRGHNLAMFLSGPNASKLRDAHYNAAVEAGHPEPTAANYAYLAICGCGETTQEGYDRANEVLGYLRTTSKVHESLMNPPGYMAVPGNVAWLKKNQVRGRAGNHFPAMKRDGTVINIGSGRDWTGSTPIPDLIDANIVFAGTPDEVAEQMAEFSDFSGGVGNIVVMGQGGDLSHEETKANLTAIGEGVLPKLNAG